MIESAVNLLVDKLIPLLTKEANLLRGVHEEVEEIARELQYIQAFLKDADARTQSEGDDNSNNHGVKLWVNELTEATFKIEDVVDEYAHFMAQQEEEEGEWLRPSKRRFIFGNIFHGVSRWIENLSPRHDIATKIQKLRQVVRGINERSRRYGFVINASPSSTSQSNKMWRDPRDDSRFLNENEVVGIQIDREELIARLEYGFTDQIRAVSSLVGMPGIGKTTLANQVYESVKEKFDCHAWIDVSQSYNKVELLRSLIRKFYLSRKESVPSVVDQEMDEYSLITNMRDYLQGKSYFVTFDDVWDTSFWGHFQNGFPRESGKKNIRGRIVITTRNVEVANFCKISSSVHIHQMKLLSFENSWRLFCSKAFHNSEHEKSCPIHLVDLSREIVERCRGLPLAIVVIGSLLATKDETVDEWRKLLTYLSSELESNEHLASINKILSLSYNDLPYNLKHCFLYFGIFPEDYSIRSQRLVRQWIAEGFVKPQKDKILEDVAEEYLVKLLNRSMVQVSTTYFDGRARSCRVHDLVREFIHTNPDYFEFCKVLSEKNTNDFMRALTTRRISFFPGTYDSSKIKDISETSRARSIFSFDVKEENLNPLIITITSNLKFVKVLDFEDCQSLDLLPDDIGNLFHLKYLSVRGTRVKVIPNSIGKLENLETLDLKRSLVYELPSEINRLCKLRHLLAYFQNELMLRRRGVRIKKGFGNLKTLLKLYNVEADADGVNVFEELSKLTELRKLVISKLRCEDETAFCSCIRALKRLESLEVYSITEEEVVDCKSVNSSLRILHLHGRLTKFNEWIAELQSLNRITLSWSKLGDVHMKLLQNLPNLLIASISRDAYFGKKLRIERGAFLRLKVLHLYVLSRMRCLEVEEGALPCLEELRIGPCPQMNEVPTGLQHLSNLKLMMFWEMPVRFSLFQDFRSLQFVPRVKFYVSINNKLTFWYLKLVLEIQKYVREHDEVRWNVLSYEEIFGKVFQ